MAVTWDSLPPFAQFKCGGAEWRFRRNVVPWNRFCSIVPAVWFRFKGDMEPSLVGRIYVITKTGFSGCRFKQCFGARGMLCLIHVPGAANHWMSHIGGRFIKRCLIRVSRSHEKVTRKSRARPGQVSWKASSKPETRCQGSYGRAVAN